MKLISHLIKLHGHLSLSPLFSLPVNFSVKIRLYHLTGRRVIPKRFNLNLNLAVFFFLNRFIACSFPQYRKEMKTHFLLLVYFVPIVAASQL